MAATAIGTFKLIDQASRALERMRRNALQTDAAFAKLGTTMAAMSGDRQFRELQRTDRQMVALTGTTKRYGRELDDITAKTRRYARENDVLSKTTVKTARDLDTIGNVARRTGTHIANLETRTKALSRAKQDLSKALGMVAKGFGMIFTVGKFAALGAGIGVLGQGVSALGGGLIALIPKLTSVAGLLAPLPVLFTGLGLSMVTVKLAFADISKAMTGNKKALAALTPEARNFIAVLKSYKPVVKELRESAQQGLFPGLTQALSNLRGGVPTMRNMLGLFGRTLGQGAVGFSRFLTDPSFLRDFAVIGRQAARIMGQLFQGLQNVLSGFRHIMIAGGPFVRWLTDVVIGWTKLFEMTAAQDRASGRTARIFSRWRQDLTRLGHILRNVWETLRNIGRAARPLGEILWRNAERTTKAWARMSGTMGGQMELTRGFLNMADSIHQVNLILGDFVRGMFKAGQSSTLPTTLAKLREVLQKLGGIFIKLAESYGPMLADFLDKLGTTLQWLTGVQGPITLLIKGMSMFLDIINKLTRAIPGLGDVLASVFGVVAFARLISSVQRLGGAWLGVRTNANLALAAEREAAGVGAVGGGFFGGRGGGRGGGGRGGGGGGGGSPFLWFGRGGRAAATGATELDALPLLLAGGNAARASRWARSGAWIRQVFTGGQGMRGIAAGIPRAVGMGGFNLARLGLGGAGALVGGVLRRFWPVMALMGAFNAISTRRHGGFMDQLVGKGGDFLSGATGGLLKARPDPHDQQAKDIRTWLTSTKPTMQKGEGHSLLGWALSGVGVPDSVTSALGMGRNKQTAQPFGHWLQRGLAPFGGTKPGSISDLQGSIPVLTTAIGKLRQARKGLHEEARAEVNTVIKGLQRERHLREQMLTTAKKIKAEEDRKDAIKKLTDFMEAYRKVEKEKGTKKALQFAQQELPIDMSKLTPKGKLLFAKKIQQWLGLDFFTKNPAFQGIAKSIQTEMGGKINWLKNHVKEVNTAIREDAKQKWQKIHDYITGPMGRATKFVGDSFGTMKTQAMSALTAMGYTAVQAQAIFAGAAAGNTGAAGPPAPGQTTVPYSPPAGKKKARGGRLSGSGLQDTVPVMLGMAAPGELVVNRHTEGRVNNMLAAYGTTLGGEVGREGRRHSDTMFARGGRTQSRKGKTSPLIDAADVGAAQSAPGGGTYTTGALGAAIAEANRIAALNLPYVFGGSHGGGMVPPNGPFDCSSAVSRVLEVAGLLGPVQSSSAFLSYGAPGMGPITIAARPGEGKAGHVYLILGGRAWGTSRSGSNPNGGPGWIGSYTTRPGFTYRVPTGTAASGLYGSIGLNAPGSGIGGVPGALADRSAQVIATGMQARINQAISSGGILPGMAYGGRLQWGGWFGEGGQLTARRPTLIGVGERGTETATITRGGATGARGRSIHVQIDKIENHREGDIEQHIKREVARAFDELAMELDHGTVIESHRSLV